ncbi:Uu.00g108740.m01.CDS01 [Anthostomella pinea]|uniref:Uu.00g108740.m01.CDS01 n=1 Tax=Anthostomella pinea TaxID=933095 RepID=A0AAI8YG87_9PEZI|nr:Uu.00g108740.m01.CDS01 [Anthostomella pinea]
MSQMVCGHAKLFVALAGVNHRLSVEVEAAVSRLEPRAKSQDGNLTWDDAVHVVGVMPAGSRFAVAQATRC